LFRNSKKKPIWTPKTINEAAKAVTNATRLMPVDFCAAPGPSSLDDVVAAAAAVVSVDDANDDIDAVVDDDNDDDDNPVGAVEVVVLIGMDVACDVGRWLLYSTPRLGIAAAATGHACQPKKCVGRG